LLGRLNRSSGGLWKRKINQIKTYVENNCLAFLLVQLFFFLKKLISSLPEEFVFKLKTTFGRSQLPTICGRGGLGHGV
jgi:hypothetical protein